jgi:hypothetical protein
MSFNKDAYLDLLLEIFDPALAPRPAGTRTKWPRYFSRALYDPHVVQRLLPHITAFVEDAFADNVPDTFYAAPVSSVETIVPSLQIAWSTGFEDYVPGFDVIARGRPRGAKDDLQADPFISPPRGRTILLTDTGYVRAVKYEIQRLDACESCTLIGVVSLLDIDSSATNCARTVAWERGLSYKPMALSTELFTRIYPESVPTSHDLARLASHWGGTFRSK